MNAGEVLHHAGVMTEDEYRRTYGGDLPLLPGSAFWSPPI
jgi:hypothetical protein